MVYKLVARQGTDGGWVSVAKASTSKASVGGRKAAFRTLVDGVATADGVSRQLTLASTVTLSTVE